MTSAPAIQHLEQALALATQSLNITSPNPRVGCVITNSAGLLLGQGHTQRAGGPHAEIMALREAAAQGHSVQDATAYVTLEPCAHHGRTGPCCDALIAAGIRAVVATNLDPNPLVAGQGFARLRAAGVAVEVLQPEHPLAIASRELNIGFFSRMVRQTPWVRMKLAASLDGKTALTNGVSQWITSPQARADGHAWRARACAVLTGIGTVLADNPQLDVRLVDTPRQPTLVVVDSRLETPLDAALFIAGRPCIICAAVQNDAKQSALEARGAQVVVLPNASGKVDLAALLRDLARREINELHLEAGEKLNGSFLREGLVDEFLVYLAPKLIGQGRDMASFGPLTDLSQAVPLAFTSVEMVGPDLRVLARVPGRDAF
ncbi:MAG: bifunctional diaminohydroxyphosphoribosylaminopyrimidine deaminase/5-amino-6-(5-phosphoribosylamino)uracil reductase RibD [Rhodoferax sp.]|nr:bifunctional diaminohydroxyphosphoribosylaminopyrimidine deaminase/5-amino-6-(5-phosphoribosylamino)uracil reductase RibD [Rhodoferax sp.]